MKEIFPNMIKKALIEPMLLRGLNGEKIGYATAPIKSQIKKKLDPMIKRIPPRLGLKSDAI